jgi:hypothetical protein
LSLEKRPGAVSGAGFGYTAVLAGVG